MENETQSSVGGGGRKKPWGAFHIVERGEKSFWNRVGSAFRNHDGSYNIFLETLPRDGKIQIREIKDDEFRKDRGALAEKAEA